MKTTPTPLTIFSTPVLLFGLSLSLAVLTACNQQGRGFALPAGDIATGKATFIKLSCNECHVISDIAWEGGTDNLKVVLGGEVSKMKSYGELVTSVINPSHKIAWPYRQQSDTEGNQSKMKNYNEIMTVQELVDIVTFLQSAYEIKTPPTYYYPYLSVLDH